MATGTDTALGFGLPLLGSYNQVQQVAANDMATLTGATSMTGNFITARNSASVTRFSVGPNGALTMASGLAADNLLTLQQAASHTGFSLQVLNSSTGKLFHIDSTGVIRTMILGTFALASLNSSSTATVSVTGLTTNDVAMIIPTSALITGNGILWGTATAAGTLTYAAAGLSVAALTAAVWAFRTVAN